MLHSVEEPTDLRLFELYELLNRDVTIQEINDITKIDIWFLAKLRNIVEIERKLYTQDLTQDLYIEAKKAGFKDKSIQKISGKELPAHIPAVYKMVDTCAAEFSAQTPYFYATYDKENEALEFLNHDTSAKRCV